MVILPLIYACFFVAGWAMVSLRLIGMSWRWSFLTAVGLSAAIGWSAWDAIAH